MSLIDRFRKKKNESYYAEYAPEKTRTERKDLGPLQTIVRLRILTGPEGNFSSPYELDVPLSDARRMFFSVRREDERWKYDERLQNLPSFMSLRRTELVIYKPGPLKEYEAKNPKRVYRDSKKASVERVEEKDDSVGSLIDPNDRSGSTSYIGMPAITGKDEKDEKDVPIKENEK